jgi:hypothetical protein
MSYTPLNDVKTELESLNTEQDGQTIIQNRIEGLLQKLIDEQKKTNKLLEKIYSHE